MLIRGFYDDLFVLIDGADRDSSYHLQRESGQPDFRQPSQLGLLMDRVRATLFSVGPESREAYSGLRIAFLRSLWHIAGVMKLSTVVELSKLS
jgi:hypothetical protein